MWLFYQVLSARPLARVWTLSKNGAEHWGIKCLFAKGCDGTMAEFFYIPSVSVADQKQSLRWAGQ